MKFKILYITLYKIVMKHHKVMKKFTFLLFLFLFINSFKLYSNQESTEKIINDFVNTYKDSNFVHPDLFENVTLLIDRIKFSNMNGKISINVSDKEDNNSSEKNSNYVVVSVKDNGVGIQEQDINKLFRIDINHTTLGTSNEKGTGLGLILCKEFIEKHNGQIWAESKIDDGATFYFTLLKT